MSRASADRIEERPWIPEGALAEPFDASQLSSPDDVSDESVVAYVVQARPIYDALRRAAAQLAGLLVLAATGGKNAQRHPMAQLARSGFEAAVGDLAALAPPPRATHHYRHLSLAAKSLARALEAAETGLHRFPAADDDPQTRHLTNTISHLRWAGQTLPGFEIVDFSQGCACHPSLSYTAEAIGNRSTRRGDARHV